MAGLQDPRHVDLENFDVPNADFYGSIQDALQQLGEAFSTFAQIHWGKKMANFFDSGTGHEQMDDAHWRPDRALGQGGFGTVGLWHNVDRDGTVMDEIAIKETRSGSGLGLGLDRLPSLAKEAVVMKQLNVAEQDCGWIIKNILRLRGFKHFPVPQKWRFYLEYAPYGDLTKLAVSYRAWRTYLPEEFLWHVFYSLARAAYIMGTGDFHDPETGNPVIDTVVHFDIKPDNVYMARPHSHSRFSNYPVIKLADFGLSELTGKYDLKNPSFYNVKGTEGYFPPEQFKFSANWRLPPNPIHHLGRYHPDDPYFLRKLEEFPEHRHLSAHNVWAIGKTMYDLVTLSLPDDLQNMMNEETTEENYWGRFHENAIDTIKTQKHPEYSLELRELITDCLHLAVRKRPTVIRLLRRTKSGMERAAQTVDEYRRGPRIYYMGHEINHMPLGTAQLSMTRKDFRGFRALWMADPRWQPLLSPRWAPHVIDGSLIDDTIREGGPMVTAWQYRPPYATVRMDHYGNHPEWDRGVLWASHYRDNDIVGRRGDGDADGDDGGIGAPAGPPKDLFEAPTRSQDGRDAERPVTNARRENDTARVYTKSEIDQLVAERGRSGPQPLRSPPLAPDPTLNHISKKASGPTLAEATQLLGEHARDMPHPSPGPSPVLGLSGPAAAASEAPARGKKRTMAMELREIDANFLKAGDYNVQGHKSRKRQR